MKTEAVATPSPSFSSQARILVVDDEPKNRELIRDTLEVRGYAIEAAASGTEALVCIAAAPPDVVLLDVSMPGMDGLEVCRQLKGDPVTASLPVIMVTAHTDRRDRLAGIEAGADDYLTKPVDLQDLLLRVRNVVRGKRLADEVKENLRRLRELEHLRDSLTHMIIHDLRSPLTTITMGLEMIRMSAANSDRKSEAKIAEASCASAEQMSEMLISLLDVSRFEAGEMPLQKTATNLAPILRAALESVRDLVATRRIALEESTGEATACCDGSVVRRILMNLIGNAVKFTPAGGKIQVSMATEGAFVRVGVTDTGAGIAPEFHERIFEKFGQVNDSRARLGTGLGLTFCKLAVEAHGGDIGVESTVGSGSTFWFTLPVA